MISLKVISVVTLGIASVRASRVSPETPVTLQTFASRETASQRARLSAPQVAVPSVGPREGAHAIANRVTTEQSAAFNSCTRHARGLGPAPVAKAACTQLARRKAACGFRSTTAATRTRARSPPPHRAPQGTAQRKNYWPHVVVLHPYLPACAAVRSIMDLRCV